MDPGIGAAVSEAYRIFSRYSFRAGSPVDHVPAGLGPLEDRLLRVTPLSEISPELLAAYAGSLPVNVDGTAADDFRALLPRYFELIAADRGPVSGWKEEALRGLARSGYRAQWPAEEADAVETAKKRAQGRQEIKKLKKLIEQFGGPWTPDERPANHSSMLY